MINSSPFTRFRYEVLFMAFILFLVGRIGHNFFWSSFLAPMVGMASESKPLLTVDFYIPADFSGHPVRFPGDNVYLEAPQRFNEARAAVRAIDGRITTAARVVS